jgi:hypothetical protein
MPGGPSPNHHEEPATQSLISTPALEGFRAGGFGALFSIEVGISIFTTRLHHDWFTGKTSLRLHNLCRAVQPTLAFSRWRWKFFSCGLGALQFAVCSPALYSRNFDCGLLVRKEAIFSPRSPRRSVAPLCECAREFCSHFLLTGGDKSQKIVLVLVLELDC